MLPYCITRLQWVKHKGFTVVDYSYFRMCLSRISRIALRYSDWHMNDNICFMYTYIEDFGYFCKIWPFVFKKNPVFLWITKLHVFSIKVVVKAAYHYDYKMNINTLPKYMMWLSYDHGRICLYSYYKLLICIVVQYNTILLATHHQQWYTIVQIWC